MSVLPECDVSPHSTSDGAEISAIITFQFSYR